MATKKCVRLQAHFQHRWDHCGQLREWRDAHRRAQKCRLEHTCMRSVVASSDVFTSHSTWLKPFALVFHSHPIHGHAQRSLSVFSPSLSTSCSTFSSSLSSWPRVTPWQSTPCATPQTGPSSPWTITSPSQYLKVLSHKISSSVRAYKNATEMSMTRIPKSLQLAAFANKYLMKNVSGVPANMS